MDKKIGISILIATLIIAGAFVYSGKRSQTGENSGTQTINAVIENGVQIVDITARGGYSPRVVKAKAGVATTLRVTTKETYDCSVSLVIPKLKYEKFLSSNGVEEIKIPAEKATGTINGLCSMGMYSFKIVFE
jgi:Cu+-exporting ATPase